MHLKERSCHENIYFFLTIWHGLKRNTMHQQIPKMLRGYFLPGSIKICLPHRKLIINCHSYIRSCWWSSWLQNERSHKKCSLSHSPQSVKIWLSTNPNLKYIKDSSHVNICFYSPSLSPLQQRKCAVVELVFGIKHFF